jgi:recombination protein RecA
MKEREKALDMAISQIEKQYGKGAIMRLGDNERRLTVAAVPTGSPALDRALGVGGLPRGLVTEIYGNEGSGKTTLAYHVIAEVQKEGGTAAFIDAEQRLDPSYARAVGVDIENLWLSQPDTGERALDIADTLVRSGGIDIFVVDSVAALVPRSELEGEMGDSQVGLQARLMSKGLRKIGHSLRQANAIGLFLNQVREKIGIMFGNPETTPGGRALKFWSSVRIELRRAETLKQGTAVYGSRIRATVKKNSIAPPFRQAIFDIIHGKGISRSADLLELGVEAGVVTRTGAFFSYGEERLGQGKDNAREFLDGHVEVADELESQLREKLGFKVARPEAEPEPRSK